MQQTRLHLMWSHFSAKLRNLQPIQSVHIHWYGQNEPGCDVVSRWRCRQVADWKHNKVTPEQNDPAVQLDGEVSLIQPENLQSELFSAGLSPQEPISFWGKQEANGSYKPQKKKGAEKDDKCSLSHDSFQTSPLPVPIVHMKPKQIHLNCAFKLF